ncbi:MAG: restriction endonuclease [Candidatus Pacebacteria bacterium]|nr:restriction endonuclease [Candidatus Paceibacterota bacterium]
MTQVVVFKSARQKFHADLAVALLCTDATGIPTIADKHSKPSVAFATGMVERCGCKTGGARLVAQRSGQQFEEAVKEFLEATFLQLGHLRPGTWTVSRGGGNISMFEQFAHLDELDDLAKANAVLATALGSDYLIKPDIIIGREPEPDEVINASQAIVDESVAKCAPLRRCNNLKPIFHASISCKWTLRSDRAQNARSEGLNLAKNRKGNSPHICVVTAEPVPGRIASIALGTGEIDCVYHIALPELRAAVEDTDYDDSKEMLGRMVEGRRLRDISDLPMDLAI